MQQICSNTVQILVFILFTDSIVIRAGFEEYLDSIWAGFGQDLQSKYCSNPGQDSFCWKIERKGCYGWGMIPPWLKKF